MLEPIQRRPWTHSEPSSKLGDEVRRSPKNGLFSIPGDTRNRDICFLLFSFIVFLFPFTSLSILLTRRTSILSIPVSLPLLEFNIVQCSHVTMSGFPLNFSWALALRAISMTPMALLFFGDVILPLRWNFIHPSWSKWQARTAYRTADPTNSNKLLCPDSSPRSSAHLLVRSFPGFPGASWWQLNFDSTHVYN